MPRGSPRRRRTTALAIALVGLGFPAPRAACAGDPRQDLAAANAAFAAAKDDPIAQAQALTAIARADLALGDSAGAREAVARTRAILSAAGDRPGTARSLLAIADVAARAADPETALALATLSKAAFERASDKEGSLDARLAMARALEALGESPRALMQFERVAADADSQGFRPVSLVARAGIARTNDAVTALRAHVEAARAALATATERPVPDGGDETLAATREKGARAAALLGDPDLAFSFEEAGRAATLSTWLAGRESGVPAGSADAIAREKARADEIAACTRLREARASGNRASVSTARAEVDRAREARIAAFEQEARACAVAHRAACRPIVRPEASADLRRGEALVLYSVDDAQASATVVTRVEARFVRLGATRDLRAAVEACRWEDDREDTTASFDALRRALIEPLGLDAGVSVLLVSPDGFLHGFPFAAIANGRDVACVPSATVLSWLRRRSAKPGEGVLAVGDPAAGPGFERMASLPAARAEARAVGDVLLLGEQASLPALADAVRARPRWRALHFACAASVDARRPLLSALRLAPSAQDDGTLKALDVFSWSFPTDLVVLSADLTATGRISGREGVEGLDRSFLASGVPRVIGSLSRVDDEATRALMTRFYESLKSGRPTASALHDAQSSVRSTPRWSHPAFWAPWVLVGLPE
jgi:CHAT domain-containing protein